MKLKIKITGDKVQGVGYRPKLWQIAMDLSLKGFDAYNMVGSKPQMVIALIEGDEERVQMFCEAAKLESPSKALVEGITAEPYDGEVMALKDYAAINTSHQLNKGIDLLLNVVENQGRMAGKLDQIIEGQIQAVEELKGLREELQPGLSMQIRELRADMKAVKDRLGMP